MITAAAYTHPWGVSGVIGFLRNESLFYVLLAGGPEEPVAP